MTYKIILNRGVSKMASSSWLVLRFLVLPLLFYLVAEIVVDLHVGFYEFLFDLLLDFLGGVVKAEVVH